MKHRTASSFTNAIDIARPVHIVDEVKCYHRVYVYDNDGQNQGDLDLIRVQQYRLQNVLHGFRAVLKQCKNKYSIGLLP